MGSKRVLIVDDEETILRLLKSSLTSLGGSYEVVTENNGESAIQKFREAPFDLVVTDYMMDGMDGMQLLAAVKELSPETRVIMITAYGSSELEQQAHDLEIYRYLTKPLEIALFRQIVKEALESSKTGPSGGSVVPESRARQITRPIEKLLAESGARCVMLCEINGKIIAQLGHTEELPFEEITALLGGSIATIMQVGVKIDGAAEVSNLAYREGKQKDLYAMNVGRLHFLILVVDRAEYSNKLGAVWYYARRIAVELSKILGEA
jgi:two-component system response regulator (stage 0 sporulation protein F)